MLARRVEELCTDIFVQVTARAFETLHLHNLQHAESCDRRSVIIEQIEVEQVVIEPLACRRFLQGVRVFHQSYKRSGQAAPSAELDGAVLLDMERSPG